MPETQLTLFDLPNSPDEIGVLLPPPELRRIDFSALDFQTSRRVIIEYIRTYFPLLFNDFVASNGIVMMSEVIAAESAKLSLRGDILANESFLPTAQSEPAVSGHLELIGQKIRAQTPASVDIACTIDNQVSTDIVILPGLTFQVRTDDTVFYELYKAPGDFTSEIRIPAGKRGIIAFGLEGRFASTVTVISTGGNNQEVIITDNNILEAPVFVSVLTGDDTTEWAVVSDPLERYGPNDRVVEVFFLETELRLKFGDNVNGAAPLAGQSISVRYRAGGGLRGRIGTGQIDEQRSVNPLPPVSALVPVRFTNPTPSVGGTDRETLEEAKKRAPREFSVHQNIVTEEDYAIIAQSFAHPVFGAVSKALATIRTGLNANLVEIYVLASGPNGQLVTPNAGLKRGLSTYFDQFNVLTDHVEILDGAILAVDVEMTIVVSKNGDASVVKSKAQAAIVTFFDASNWEMGESLYVSNLIEVIEAIDGVLHVDLFKPLNNILPTGQLVSGTDDGIGLNEVIVAGNLDIKIYYEKGRVL